MIYQIVNIPSTQLTATLKCVFFYSQTSSFDDVTLRKKPHWLIQKVDLRSPDQSAPLDGHSQSKQEQTRQIIIKLLSPVNEFVFVLF